MSKTVIELAKEAGFPFNKYGLLQGDDNGEIDADAMLERLVELVRADERAKLAEQPAQQEIDWKDQYEKQKRRADMWVAKYEADIGPLEKAGPVAEQPAPVVNVQHKRTTYPERFTHAVAVLCGAQPPAEMVAEWFEDVEVNGGHRLQSWVGAQHATPSWAQCIVVLDAAHVLASDPEEGEGHETAKLTPQAPKENT